MCVCDRPCYKTDSRPSLIIQDLSKCSNPCIPFIPQHGAIQHILFDGMARLVVEHCLKLDPCCTSKIFIVGGQMALLQYLRIQPNTPNDKLYQRFLLGITDCCDCCENSKFPRP